MVNASRVIQFLYPNAVPIAHYEVTHRDQWEDGVQGQRITFWKASVLGPEPTFQELAQTEATQAFIDWNQEHGGNASLTNRRKAREVFESTAPEMVLFKALALVMADLTSQTPTQIRNRIITKLEGLL